MKLQGFSRYDFHLSPSRLRVQNGSRVIRGSTDRFHDDVLYNLIDDNGNTVRIGAKRIAYCILSSCSPSEIKGKRVYGTIQNPMLSSRPSAKKEAPLYYLAELEQTIETIRLIYMTGKIDSLLLFSEREKQDVIGRVSKVLQVKRERIKECYSDGVQVFIHSCTTCNFRKLQSLKDMLTNSVKVAYLRTKTSK